VIPRPVDGSIALGGFRYFYLLDLDHAVLGVQGVDSMRRFVVQLLPVRLMLTRPLGGNKGFECFPTEPTAAMPLQGQRRCDLTSVQMKRNAVLLHVDEPQYQFGQEVPGHRNLGPRSSLG
jgi:hypothetical protein